jgi:hypothetical protein
MPNIRHATAAVLSVEGELLKWIESRGTKEGRIEMAWELGEAVLSFGLVVAGSYFTGGLGAILLIGSALLSGYSALSQTNELIKANAATNTALDPTAGLLPPRNEAATELGVGVNVLETTMNYAKGNVLNVLLMEAGEFSAKYGDDVQAVTLLKAGQGGKVNVEIISSKGVTQEARQAALAEEFVHLQPLANPVMRAKMLKLTEENLANWPQMSRADRVDLIQTKLEVEADAQKILLNEGEGSSKSVGMVQDGVSVSAIIFKSVGSKAQADLAKISSGRELLDDISGVSGKSFDNAGELANRQVAAVALQKIRSDRAVLCRIK